MVGPTSVRAENPGQRVDKWLFFARFAKSRTLAARLVEEGRVRINRDKVDSPRARSGPATC
jgi:ribosome-associated heat shock protein Hsp15